MEYEHKVYALGYVLLEDENGDIVEVSMDDPDLPEDIKKLNERSRKMLTASLASQPELDERYHDDSYQALPEPLFKSLLNRVKTEIYNVPGKTVIRTPHATYHRED